jgi:excisionase family DNA binding protein
MHTNLYSLNEKVNLTISKEDLLFFAEQVIQKYTEQGQVTKYPAQMTISQVASYLNYSQAAIYKMVGSYTIPFYQTKTKGKILFKRAEIDSWLAEGRQSTVTDFCIQQERK